MGTKAITTTEKQILAICLKDKSHIIKLDANHFLSEIGQLLYKAFTTMESKDKELEYSNTNIVIFANNDVIDIPTLEMLRGLETNVDSFDIYLDELRKMKALDNIRVLNEKLFRIGEGKNSLSLKETKLLRDELDKNIRVIEGDTKKIYTMPEMYEKYQDIIEERLDGTESISTGDPYLDQNLTFKFQMQNITIVGGQSGSGKSAYALHLFEKMANKSIPVLYMNLELNLETQATRILQMRQKLSSDVLNFTSDNFDNEHIADRIENEKLRMSKNKRAMLSFEESIDLYELEDIIENTKKKMGVDHLVIIIDLLPLLGSWQTSPLGQIECIDELHRIVRRTNSHVVGLVQLNRSAEANSNIAEPSDIDKFLRPKISSIFSGSAFEQRARTILLLYRKKHFMTRYFPDDDMTKTMDDIAEISIAKQTQGPLARLYYLFDTETFNWYKYDKDKMLLKKAELIKQQNKLIE